MLYGHLHTAALKGVLLALSLAGTLCACDIDMHDQTGETDYVMRVPKSGGSRPMWVTVEDRLLPNVRVTRIKDGNETVQWGEDRNRDGTWDRIKIYNPPDSGFRFETVVVTEAMRKPILRPYVIQAIAELSAATKEAMQPKYRATDYKD